MITNSFLKADILAVVVARHYEATLGASVVSIGNAPAWDLRFQDGTSMEVKLDAAATKTERLAFEYWDLRKNRPTGILATRATLWLHCTPYDQKLRCFEFSIDTLRRAVIEKGTIRQGGDFNASLLKCIDVSDIEDIAIRVFPLDHELISSYVL